MAQQPSNPDTQTFGTPVATPQRVVSGEPPKAATPQSRPELHAQTPVVVHQAGRAAPPRAAMPGGGGFSPQPPRANEKVTPAVPMPAAGRQSPATIKATKATILGQGVPQGTPAPRGVAPAMLDDDPDFGMTPEHFFARPGHVEHVLDDLPTPKHQATGGRSAADQMLEIDLGDGGLRSPSLAPPAIPVAQAAAFNPHQPGGEFKPFQPPADGHQQPHQPPATGHNNPQARSMDGGQPPAGGHPTFAPAGQEGPIKPPLNPVPWWLWASGAVIILAIIACCVLLMAVPALRSLKGRWDNWHPVPTTPAPQRPPQVEPVPSTPGQLVDPLDHCTRSNTVGGTVDNNAVLMCCRVRVDGGIQAASTQAHGVWVRVDGQDAPSQMGTSGYAQVCIPGNRLRVRWRE